MFCIRRLRRRILLPLFGKRRPRWRESRGSSLVSSAPVPLPLFTWSCRRKARSFVFSVFDFWSPPRPLFVYVALVHCPLLPHCCRNLQASSCNSVYLPLPWFQTGTPGTGALQPDVHVRLGVATNHPAGVRRRASAHQRQGRLAVRVLAEVCRRRSQRRRSVRVWLLRPFCCCCRRS